MDILEQIATELYALTELKCEVQPSISSMKDTRLILSVRSGWIVETNDIETTEYVFGDPITTLDIHGNQVPEVAQNPKVVREITAMLPISLDFYSEGSSQTWRNDILSRSLKCAIALDNPLHINAINIKIRGALYDLIIASVPEFENKPITALKYMVEFDRNESGDLPFVESAYENAKQGSNIFKMNWNGNIIFKTGGLENDS